MFIQLSNGFKSYELKFQIFDRKHRSFIGSLLHTVQHGSGKRFYCENVLFQDNNDPKHSSHTTYLMTIEEKVKLFQVKCPPQPSDLLSIDLAWHKFNRKGKRARSLW